MANPISLILQAVPLPQNSARTATERAPGRPFSKGQSGNPAGKRKGTRNRSTMAAEALLEGECEALTRKAIELALAGDTMALRLCLERLVPPRKERPIRFELPAIASEGDAARAMGAVLAALAAGQITPSEATAVAGLIDAARLALAPEPCAAVSVQPVIHVEFVAPSSEAGNSRRELCEYGTGRN